MATIALLISLRFRGTAWLRPALERAGAADPKSGPTPSAAEPAGAS
jgi:hypothetical protein